MALINVFIWPKEVLNLLHVTTISGLYKSIRGQLMRFGLPIEITSIYFMALLMGGLLVPKS